MAKPKYDWTKVDWNQSNRDIANALGCPYDTVAHKRLKLGVGRAKKVAQRSDKGVSKTTYIPPKEQQLKQLNQPKKAQNQASAKPTYTPKNGDWLALTDKCLKYAISTSL